MLLSKRRLRWATVCLLFACCLLLIQPTRVWLQHIWIAGTLGSQVTVGEVVYRNQNSVVEVRDLTWQGVRAAEWVGGTSDAPAVRHFTVNAPRCWLGIDRKVLADGRIHLPKVILQETVVTLTSSFPETKTNLDTWRHGVTGHLEQFEWKNLEQRVSCLFAAEKLKTAWSERTEHLVECSQGILTEVARIEEETAAMDNPLRFEESIRARLTRYKELSGEQHVLRDQLKDIESELCDESQRLEKLHGQDVRTLELVGAGIHATTSLENSDFILAQQLALVIAEAGWEQVAPYGEVVATTSQAAANFRAADYDVTVRAGAVVKDHIHCSDLKASGEFRFAQISSPFQTSGSWRLAQQSPGHDFRELNFLTSFDCQTHQLEITAGHDSRQSTAIHLRIRMLSQNAVKRAKISAATIDETTINSLAPVTARLTSDSGNLSGTLRVAAEALPLLSRKLPSNLLASLQDTLNDSPEELVLEPLRFDMSGTWQQPRLKISGSAPVWLQQAVERMLSQQSQEILAQSKQKLDTEFNQRIEQMREKGTLAIGEAQRVVSRDESALLTSQQRLQRRFDEMNGTEFARRTDEVQR